jgi:DNA repair exonuclease SbcCD ATPase subunit
MKTKVGMVVLIVACVGLIVALFTTKKAMDDRVRKDADAIVDFSNQLTTATANLDELRQVNLMLTNDLASSRQEALTFSNQFTETTGALADTKASLQNTRDQITRLNSHIADLEAQNQVLDQRAAALTNAIASLNAQIADTQQKLAGSETNNAFLEKELQQQTAARAELESKFNNLSTVRAQIKKLKADLFIARRLEWMRKGSDPGLQQKGGQLLIQRTPATNSARPPHYDLNVEVSSDGSIHVIPSPTNAPAATTNRPPR